MRSIIQEERECFICKSPYVEDHHIFYSRAFRYKSEQYGLKVWLCSEHHRGNSGVHFNKKLDLELKRLAETKWLEYYHKTISEFIKEFGKNVL